jgi:hypothetical protein
MDPTTGRVPNLGPNDGAYILPLTNCPFEDYRPVVQSAGKTFLCKPVFQPGLWDEMTEWIGISKKASISTNLFQSMKLSKPIDGIKTPIIIKSPNKHSWVYLRAVKFYDRPGHADQLHIDLWWHGNNIAQDAGTFLYNAHQPWNNSLASTNVHNTLIIDNHDQMTRAGRFLFLSWAQTKIIYDQKNKRGEYQKIIAQHDGYRHFGLIHQREVSVTEENKWLIIDKVIPSKQTNPSHRTHKVTLQWLLPDWLWSVNENIHHVQEPFELSIKSPEGNISLSLSVQSGNQSKLLIPGFQLIRAGENIFGQGNVFPTWGWTSPTYGVRIPALSLRVTVSSTIPIQFLSEWSFNSQ